MDDVTRHPDDATLFDLVEETLDPARAEVVRAHLSRCAACAAFVQAARAGAPATSSAVEAMPTEAAANLHAAVSTAWRERVAGIAAAEAAQDRTAPVAAPVPAGEFAGYAPTDRPAVHDASDAALEPAPAPRRRRGRRLVPVLAFVVLGTLAGTSVLIGDETNQQASVGRGDSGAASEDAPSPNSATSEGAPPATDLQEPALEAPTAEPGVEADAAGAGAADAGAAKADRDAGVASSDAEASAVPPPADYEEFVDQDLVCIATIDETQLVLPDGRLPSQITQGPFGLYLVCG